MQGKRREERQRLQEKEEGELKRGKREATGEGGRELKRGEREVARKEEARGEEATGEGEGEKRGVTEATGGRGKRDGELRGGEE